MRQLLSVLAVPNSNANTSACHLVHISLHCKPYVCTCCDYQTVISLKHQNKLLCRLGRYWLNLTIEETKEDGRAGM